MSKKNTKDSSAVETTSPVAPTEQEINAEAFNVPQKKDQFTFGGRTFTVVSLGYREYLRFLSYLKPVLDAISSKVKSGLGVNKEQVSVPGLIVTGLTDIDSSYIFEFCADSLPAMVELVCNMEAIAAKNTDDLITTEWIEENAQDPFELIDIVLRQVNKNQIIVKFASFFAQVLPMFLGTKNQAK